MRSNCARPEPQHKTVMTAVRTKTLKIGINPCCSGFQVQDAANVPTGVTLLYTASVSCFTLIIPLCSTVYHINFKKSSGNSKTCAKKQRKHRVLRLKPTPSMYRCLIPYFSISILNSLAIYLLLSILTVSFFNDFAYVNLQALSFFG